MVLKLTGSFKNKYNPITTTDEHCRYIVLY